MRQLHWCPCSEPFTIGGKPTVLRRSRRPAGEQSQTSEAPQLFEVALSSAGSGFCEFQTRRPKQAQATFYFLADDFDRADVEEGDTIFLAVSSSDREATLELRQSSHRVISRQRTT